MKKFLGTISLTLLILLSRGQSSRPLVKGLINDSPSNAPVSGAVVALGNLRAITDEKGYFSFGKVNRGVYHFTVNSLGYKNHSQDITVSRDTALNIQLNASIFFLDPLEVRSLRASDKAPFAKTDISKEEIVKNNLGQDIPFLLGQTPSMVINSDAGNGVGYTAMRIRGTDASRINVTLNGIPYNDAESMGTYFVDLPDFASSVNSIQVQRGVGTSSNGASAFGATVNLSTNEYNEKAYGELNNSFGSFNTWKNTVKAGTGLINDHFTVDARLSRVSSDGYIDRASSDLQSFYLSTAWLNKTSSLRFNLFSGKEKTYQAWYGVPGNMLATNRTYNPAGTEKPGMPYDNQTDNYTQTHYQLFFNHAFNSNWSFNTAVFLTRGYGYYEEYKAGASFADYGLPNTVIGSTTMTKSDLVRQRWLDNYFYGQIAAVQYRHGGDELTIGGGWTRYDGKHFGTIPWMQVSNAPKDYRYYDYPAVKKDAHSYVKWQRRINNRWSGFADLQYRHVNHTMNGFEGNGSLNVNRSFDFINPKAGITYHHNGWQGYASYALGNKEPNRDDFQASPVNQPKQETLHDVELGVEKRNSRYFFGASLYYMYYHNQLVLTGQINDVGSYTRINIPDSYRMGAELQAGATPARWINFAGNLAISRNKIRSFTEYIDNYDTGGQDAVAHTNTDISFSPGLIGGLTINLLPVRDVTFSLFSKYVGKQYMDNSQDDRRKLDPYFTEDLQLGWVIANKGLKEWHIIARVNNLFNKKYEPNGYTYNYTSSNKLVTENSYYPMAGTNFIFGINVKL